MAAQETYQKIEQGDRGLKEIFIVVKDTLEIHPARVLAAEWKHPSGYFSAIIGDLPITAHRGSWDRISDYAAFGTKEAAEEFRDEKSGAMPTNRHREPHR